MVYFKTATEKAIPDQEPFTTFLNFVQNTETFSDGAFAEFHVFAGKENKYCFSNGFFKGNDSDNGILSYYIEGAEESGVYFILITYSSEFDMDDAHGLIGKWGALARRFPYFYVQNTDARTADLTIVDTEDVNKGRANIRLEAITHNRDCLEGIGCEMISYLIGALAIED